MNNDPQLIRQINTWLHFIGGHYGSPETFLREAQSLGVSRRVPAQTARGMNFGDRVVLLRYGGKGKVEGFAEFTVHSIRIEGDITQRVGDELIREGRASVSQGAGLVERECGAYFEASVFNVASDVTIGEILERALKIAKEEGLDLTVLIGGALSKVYDAPILLDPAPKFSRGFTKCPDQAQFEFAGAPATTERQLVELSSYKQANRKNKKARGHAAQIPMLPAPEVAP